MMIEVDEEKIYFNKELPGFLYSTKGGSSQINENMIGTTQMIGGVSYFIKGISYRMKNSRKFTRVIIVRVPDNDNRS